MLGLVGGLEQRMTETDGAINPNALSVGTAEREKLRHARQNAAIHWRAIEIHYSYDAAQRSPVGPSRKPFSALRSVSDDRLSNFQLL